MGCTSVVVDISDAGHSSGGAGTTTSGTIGDTTSSGVGGSACSTPADCPDTDIPCQQRTCIAGTCGLTNAPAGTSLPDADQTPADCQLAVCDGSGGITTEPDDTDIPDDANPCTTDLCTAGVPSHLAEPLGTPCGAALICDGAAQCVGCISPSDCPGQDTTCQQRTCESGICGLLDAAANQPLPAAEQTPGDCQLAVCDGVGGTATIADDTDIPTSTNECASGACANGTASSTPLPAETPCNQSGGVTCDGAGACVQCNQGTDCPSGVCQAHTCQAPTCTDGVRNQGELGTDCGGPCAAACPTVVVVAAGPSGTFGATYHPGGDWTTTTALGGMSTDPPSVAFMTNGEAVAGIRLTQSGNPSDNNVQFATWAAETWSAFTDVGPGVATTHGPSVGAEGGGAVAAYRGLDGKYYTTTWSGNVWAGPDPVLSYQGVHSAGVSAPAFTPCHQGSDLRGALFFVGNDQFAYGQQRTKWTTLVWFSADLIVPSPVDDVSPVATQTTNVLGDCFATFVRGQKGEYARWYTSSSGAFSSAGDGLGPTTDPMAIAMSPQGTEIITASRLVDGSVYYRTDSGGQTSGNHPLAIPNIMALSAPALTPGVAGATAEIAFIQPDGVAYYARLVGNAWTPPVAIGGSNLTHVAIASWSP